MIKKLPLTLHRDTSGTCMVGIGGNLHVGLSLLVSYDNPTTVRELHVFDWCSGDVAPMATNVMKIDLLESEQTLV